MRAGAPAQADLSHLFPRLHGSRGLFGIRAAAVAAEFGSRFLKFITGIKLGNEDGNGMLATTDTNA